MFYFMEWRKVFESIYREDMVEVLVWIYRVSRNKGCIFSFVNRNEWGYFSFN